MLNMENLGLLLFLSFGVMFDLTIAQIYGGDSANIKEFPHQVSIRIRGSHNCGGSIIDEWHILTAAHCLVNTDYQYYTSLTIHLGTSTIDRIGQQYFVADKLIHPSYKLDPKMITAVNDIGIIKLNDKIVFSKTVKPIALPNQEPQNDVNGTIIGYGTCETGFYSRELRKLDVTMLTMQACQPLLVSKMYDTQVCAKCPVGEGACHGDSGGPLVINGKLVGIASWVEEDVCATTWPDVYTNVYSFLSFINNFRQKSVASSNGIRKTKSNKKYKYEVATV